MNEIQTQTKDITVTAEKIIEYMEVFGQANDLDEREKRQFIEVATEFALNPFKREIYCVPYKTKDGRKLNLITGYEVYLKRAERTGRLNGWKVEVSGKRSSGDLKAVVTIWRKDWEQPFVHEAYWAEYAQRNQMWDNKPVTMTKKVAIAQAFRMTFPDELGGIPYTSDELPDVTPDIPERKPESPKKEPEPEKKFKKQEAEEAEILPEDFVSDDPDEKVDDKELYIESVQDDIQAERDQFLEYINNDANAFYVNKEISEFVHSIDIAAIKEFRKNGTDPVAYIKSLRTRLEKQINQEKTKEFETKILNSI